MALIARVIGVSLFAGALGAGLGAVLFQQYGDTTFVSLLLGCFGAIIGAVAGAAYEIVAVLRQRSSS